ncbi:MAG: DUF3179 domain-containing protein [Chloroflexi bacterium]|nr:DUF3179 domain-containing protein [Chloroflexota bacterium]
MYDAEVGGTVRSFGTSGFLYNSNKLMYDRGTLSLWHSLTGEPVVGKLANSGLELDLLPLVLTTWEEWLAENPDTTVLAEDQGFSRRYHHPEDHSAIYYDYFHIPDVMFPAYLTDERRLKKDRVLALKFFGAASAYPIEILSEELVVNDTIGPQEVVIVSEPRSKAARAYDRGGHTFSPADAPRQVLDENGELWALTETDLFKIGDEAQKLRRLPSHESFWFGWYAFNPQTKLYGS